MIYITLLKLNTKDINRCHYTNVARRMIKINTIRALPKRTIICQFHHLFSTCATLLLTSILSCLVEVIETTQSPENTSSSCFNLAISRQPCIYIETKGVVNSLFKHQSKDLHFPWIKVFFTTKTLRASNYLAPR